MPYCSKCGVEIAPGVKKCVLCSTPVQTFEHYATPNESPYPSIPAPDKTKGIIVWFMATSLLFATALTTLAINLVLNGAITWSSYIIAGVAVVLTYSTLVIFLIRKRWIVSVGWIISTTAFLGSLNAIDAAQNWFLPLGLPLTLLSGACIILVLFALTHIKSVSGLLAAMLGIVAFCCLGIDFLITRFIGRSGVGWSLIVTASIVSLEGSLLFYALYLRHRVDLRRYFHL